MGMRRKGARAGAPGALSARRPAATAARSPAASRSSGSTSSRRRPTPGPSARTRRRRARRAAAHRRADRGELGALASRRLSHVDRNMLRVATYELLVPAATSRRASPSTRRSRSPSASAATSPPTFVNGVLDHIARDASAPKSGQRAALVCGGMERSATIRTPSSSAGKRAGPSTRTHEAGPIATRPKFYCLEMFPYPSGRIHMGHVRNYTIGDVIARQRRMRGLQRAASDRLGRLRPAGGERRHRAGRRSCELDRATTSPTCADSCSASGFSYDWERELATCDPDYYRWEQRFFLAMLERGSGLPAEAASSTGARTARRCWPTSRSIDGACWRCDVAGRRARARAVVLPHHRLRRRAARRSAIGSRAGRSACSPCSATGSAAARAPRCASRWWDARTRSASSRPAPTRSSARPSSAWRRASAGGGAVRAARAAEAGVAAFVARVRAQRSGRSGRDGQGGRVHGRLLPPSPHRRAPADLDRGELRADGVRDRRGDGACPRHDQRDFEFARHARSADARRGAAGGRSVSIRRRWTPRGKGRARLVGSGDFDGLAERRGRSGASRPRWPRRELGHGAGDVSPARLGRLAPALLGNADPGRLLRALRHRPGAGRGRCPSCCRSTLVFSGRGGSPLATHAEHSSTRDCPRCGGPARRETDTMDTFVESSWYFLRYVLAAGRRAPFDPAELAYWLTPRRPVHRRHRARRPAPAVRALLHQGAARSRLRLRARRAVPPPADAGDGDQGRRQDEQVEGQRRRSRLAHRTLRRRHGAAVLSVRVAARARPRLERSGRRGDEPVPRTAVAAGAGCAAAPRRTGDAAVEPRPPSTGSYTGRRTRPSGG